MSRQTAFSIGLSLGLLVCLLIYWPGLAGGFLLDDFPNLDKLSLLNSLAPDGEFWRAVMMGQSGPSGRPISMLTFALQHADWPTNPKAFKLVNLLIHLACGILLFWFATLITRLRCANQTDALPVALVASLFWLLNPLHVSTTLYVVQRMTQLACFFTLLACCLYLVGRNRTLCQTNARSGWILMVGSAILGTLLATLSKENGVLLPGLILVLEFTLLSSLPRPIHWRLLSLTCLWFPVLTLMLYMVWKAPEMANGYNWRPFTLTERILTEPRVLLDYVNKFFLPRPSQYGLFFDDYPISKSFFNPASTAISILIWSALTLSGLVFRKRYPWWSFAVFWFIFAHLLESSFLPLEIYFEHRNYIPSMSLAVGVGALAFSAWEKASARHVKLSIIGLMLILLTGYSLVTFKEVELWSNPIKQITVWSKVHPNSLRSQIVWGWLLTSSGEIEQAEEIYRKGDQIQPDDPFFIAKGLELRCFSQNTQWPEPDEFLGRLGSARYSKMMQLTLEGIVNEVENGKCQNIPNRLWIKAIDILLQNKNYAPSSAQLWLFRARLLAIGGNIDSALHSIEHALTIYPNLPFYTYPIFWLVSSNRSAEAVIYLEKARALEKSQILNGVLFAPVLDEWENRIKQEIQQTR